IDGCIDVGVGGDDDGVLAAHLEDGALDEALAGLGAGGALVDLEANLLGAGEGDEVDLRAVDEEAAWVGAALEEVYDAVGQPGLVEQSDEAGGDGGRVGGRLEHDGVAGDDSGRGHAGHDGEGEVPGRNDGADAEGDVAEDVALAGILDGRGGGVELEGFAGVELEEVDALANVGVGLGPVLADLEDEPGTEVEVALADELRGADEDSYTVGGRKAGPGRERGRGGVDGALDLGGAGGVVSADDLGRTGGVGGGELRGAPGGMAADDEVPGAAELGADAGESVEHGAMVVGCGEVGEGLVPEGRKCGGGHRVSL